MSRGILLFMRNMGLILGVVFSVFIVQLAQGADPTAPSINPGQAKSTSGNNVTIFSDQVFENVGGSKQEAPTKSPSGRSYGSEPNYNTEQRDTAISACAGLEDNPKAQKDCYRSNLQQQVEKTKQSIDSGRKSKKPSDFDL